MPGQETQARTTLENRLADLPAGISWGVATQADLPRPGPPARSRERDFLLGRRALDRALAQAGARCGPVPVGPGGRPRLPAGVAGSLSHSAGIAVAIAAAAARYRFLGVDIEFSALPLRAARIVLSDGEREWVMAASRANHQAWRLLAAFSAKESAFKALSAVAGEDPGWLRAIGLAAVPGGFLAVHRRSPGLTLPVQVRAIADGVVSWACLAAPAVSDHRQPK